MIFVLLGLGAVAALALLVYRQRQKAQAREQQLIGAYTARAEHLAEWCREREGELAGARGIFSNVVSTVNTILPGSGRMIQSAVGLIPQHGAC